MHYYQRLRDIREDSDKTQADIADLLKTAREQYQKYESGKQELPMHHFITLAKYYGVSLDYLAGIIPTPKPLKTSPTEYSSEEIQLIRAYRNKPEVQGVIKAALGLPPDSTPDPAGEMSETLISAANAAAKLAKKKTRSD